MFVCHPSRKINKSPKVTTLALLLPNLNRELFKECVRHRSGHQLLLHLHLAD